MMVVGTAAAAEDAQAEVLAQRPHLGGEEVRVVAFRMVEPDEFLGAQR